MLKFLLFIGISVKVFTDFLCSCCGWSCSFTHSKVF